MKPTGVRLILALLVLVLAVPVTASAQLMIIGNDEKVTWDDAGTRSLLGPGRDTISIVDISTPESPRIVTNLPLTNSIFGPPVNLAITPDGRLALVAKSVEHVLDGAGWKFVLDNKLYVIDLTTSPPSHIATVEVGKQPSGLDINRAGNLALVTNRADNTISVLSIQGKDVKLIDTVPMGDQVASVAFTPDGPMILEGNTNWSAGTYQSLRGEPLGLTKFADILATQLTSENIRSLQFRTIHD